MRNTCRRNRPSPEQETRPLPMLKLSGWCAIIAPTKARELCEKDTVRLPWHYLNDVLKASENAYFWRKWCKTDTLKFDFSAIQKFYYKFTTSSSSDMTIKSQKQSPRGTKSASFGTAFCLSAILSKTCFFGRR